MGEQFRTELLEDVIASRTKGHGGYVTNTFYLSRAWNYLEEDERLRSAFATAPTAGVGEAAAARE